MCLSIAVDDGYGFNMNEPLFFNKKGLPGLHRENMNTYCKLVVSIEFSQIDLVFVGNRCDTNINMSNNKLSKSKTRAHTKGFNITIPGCTSDTGFTTMGITVLTGEPVCTVVIIQKSTELNFVEINDFDKETNEILAW